MGQIIKTYSEAQAIGLVVLYSIVFFLVGVVIGALAAEDYCDKVWHKELVSSGHADHNSQTGEWQWIDGKEHEIK